MLTSHEQNTVNIIQTQETNHLKECWRKNIWEQS